MIRHRAALVTALAVMVAPFMEVLDTSVANVALPHIAGALGADTDESTWVLTSYLVSNAIVLPLSGWLAQVFGRKRLYQACIALFTASSALCGMAQSLDALILCRVCQGIGGGALQPLSQAMVRDAFPPERQGMGMAIFGMGVVLAPIVGPLLGGWLTDNYSWRWIFYINVPAGLLAIILTALVVDDGSDGRARRGRIGGDILGVSLLVIGIGSLEIFLDEGQRLDWFSSQFILTFAVLAAVGLATLVVWELRAPSPVLHLRLLAQPNFAVACVMMFALGFVLYGSTLILPLFVQTLLGYSATLSGLVMSPGGVVVLLSMPVVGALLSRVSPRILTTCGLMCGAAGMVHLSGLDLQADTQAIVIGRMIQSLGMAFLFVPINTAAFIAVAPADNNHASGLINLMRNIGGSSGIALITTFIARRSQEHHARLAEHVSLVDPVVRARLEGLEARLVEAGASAADAVRQADALLQAALQRQAAQLAFLDAFLLLASIFVVLIPLALTLRGRPHGAVGID
ncbi:EmrB/QacA family drug resistance transporter [Luteitalea sp. TBR-22]|uniref:DHA2 family efflux MFS transporter permease subunit n=1 Tax=Luteitalea sp. TBR-22 TaxID=2802971 RepID=UPI001AFBA8D8|nr:DHA2 family efflux MFS transporter permease subunit [Luteitalea sp. TBR-22]BCS35047.1 EmrB/QacA family drug resistance transporter [Luteitalea sp. TBR-22]